MLGLGTKVATLTVGFVLSLLLSQANCLNIGNWAHKIPVLEST